jgi:hypothetical protein
MRGALSFPAPAHLSAEWLALALEIMNKIENGLTDKTIPQMPTTLRRQLTETLGVCYEPEGRDACFPQKR